MPPVTARRILRWTLVWAAAAAIAVAALALSAPDWVRVLTVGLPTPGGAFFATGAPIAGLATLLLLGISFFFWWAFGPTVLPPIVWVAAAAVGAATRSTPPVESATLLTAAAPALLGLGGLAIHLLRAGAQRRRGAALNEQLAAAPVRITGAPGASRPAPAEESTAEDLAHLRHALDMALQPIDQFDGFLFYDQYREAAVRYQCYMLGYALGIARSTRTPAFAGYLAAAQRGAIEKVGDRRVWGYWASENAWGRGRLDRDPVNVPGNIMLTGYHGMQIGMYEAFGDDRYSQPGGITYRWSEREAYENSFTTITQSVRDNMMSADYALFPCEPNWIYTVCNAFGLGALSSHDAVRGTAWMDEVRERVLASYETEFLRPDGRLIGMRSNHCGLSWNFWSGEAVQLSSAFWLHPSLPSSRTATGSCCASACSSMPTVDRRCPARPADAWIQATTASAARATRARAWRWRPASLATRRSRPRTRGHPCRGGGGGARRRRPLPQPLALHQLRWAGEPVRSGERAARSGRLWRARACAHRSATGRCGLPRRARRPGNDRWRCAGAGAAPRGRRLPHHAAPRSAGARAHLRSCGAVDSSVTADGEGRALLTVELGDRLEVRVTPSS